MEITFMGGASFLIKGGRTVAINPRGKSEADITLHSARKPNTKLIVNGPGEYEIGGVLITSVEIDGDLIHAVTVDEINVLYLTGDASRLDENAMAAIGKVDALLVDAADLKRAQTAISELMPRVVIPFGAHAAEVCKAAGGKDAEPLGRFVWNGTAAPAKAVLLKAPAKNRSEQAA